MNITTQELINFRVSTSKSFLWKPAKKAAERRYNEERKTFSFRTLYDDKEIEVNSFWTETCSHVYSEFSVYEDGVKKDLRVLKKLPADLIFNSI